MRPTVSAQARLVEEGGRALRVVPGEVRGERAELQKMLREFADKHAPADLKGWWRDPHLYVVFFENQQIGMMKREKTARDTSQLC